MDVRGIAMITGWLWIITFITSIPARFIFYAPVLEDGKDYVLGQGDDAMTLIALGALLELILIIANIGTPCRSPRRSAPTSRACAARRRSR
jgi:hypothetical protein